MYFLSVQWSGILPFNQKQEFCDEINPTIWEFHLRELTVFFYWQRLKLQVQPENLIKSVWCLLRTHSSQKHLPKMRHSIGQFPEKQNSVISFQYTVNFVPKEVLILWLILKPAISVSGIEILSLLPGFISTKLTSIQWVQEPFGEWSVSQMKSIWIMNVYEHNPTNIFMKWKMKMFHLTRQSLVNLKFSHLLEPMQHSTDTKFSKT